MNLSKQTEGVPPGSGWRLSGQHQLAIALLATTGLVVFGFFYGWSVWQGDQDDIDQASATPRTFQVDVNRAVVGELMAVPNVGPKMAQAIIEHRNTQGPFESLDELQNVSGIGSVKLDQLKEHLLPVK